MDGIDQTLVVVSPGAVCGSAKAFVVGKQTLEVSKLPVWNEDGGQQPLALLPDVHQLNALRRIGQALDSEGYAFDTLELDLKT